MNIPSEIRGRHRFSQWGNLKEKKNINLNISFASQMEVWNPHLWRCPRNSWTQCSGLGTRALGTVGTPWAGKTLPASRILGFSLQWQKSCQSHSLRFGAEGAKQQNTGIEIFSQVTQEHPPALLVLQCQNKNLMFSLAFPFTNDPFGS